MANFQQAEEGPQLEQAFEKSCFPQRLSREVAYQAMNRAWRKQQGHLSSISYSEL